MSNRLAPPGEKSAMHQHGPTCLTGPVSRVQPWWKASANASTLPEPSSSSDAEIRRDLVERVRREIQEGTYDTPEKWEAALKRLLERLERTSE